MIKYIEQIYPGFGSMDISLWIVSGFIMAVLIALSVVAMWKVFTKAGEKGWKSLIPVYNSYIMFKICWSEKAFINVIIIYFMALINELLLPNMGDTFRFVVPIVFVAAFIYLFVIEVKLNIKLSRVFGHGVAFGLGLLFFKFIFTLILGFGSSVYTKPNIEQEHKI